MFLKKGRKEGEGFESYNCDGIILEIQDRRQPDLIQQQG